MKSIIPPKTFLGFSGCYPTTAAKLPSIARFLKSLIPVALPAEIIMETVFVNWFGSSSIRVAMLEIKQPKKGNVMFYQKLRESWGSNPSDGNRKMEAIT